MYAGVPVFIELELNSLKHTHRVGDIDSRREVKQMCVIHLRQSRSNRDDGFCDSKTLQGSHMDVIEARGARERTLVAGSVGAKVECKSIFMQFVTTQ